MKYSTFDINDIKSDIIEYLVKNSCLTHEEALLVTEVSKNYEKCDFTIQLAKVLRGKADENNNVKDSINISENDLFTEVKKAGTCYNVKINKAKYCKKIFDAIMNSLAFDRDNITDQKNFYGSRNIGKGGTVVVDFSSPNIAKKFHAGHLRTTVLGNFLCNLYKYLNFNVVGINHLGDWGKQFGLVGVGFNKYGSKEELEKDAIKHLLEVYIKINKDVKAEYDALEVDGEQKTETKQVISKTDQEARDYFTSLEQGDPEKIIQWKLFRTLSLEKYKLLYYILNIKFDVYGGESFYAKTGKEIVQDAEVEDDGSMFYNLKNLGKFFVLKDDGSTLYSTRDIAAAIDRVETYNPVKLIYVVASQQDLYFQQLFSVLKGEYGIKRRVPDHLVLDHVSFGMVNGLSTRKGNLVFLEDIIDTAKDAMLTTMKKNQAKYKEIENLEETCTTLAISAMIIQDFNSKRKKNYNFDMKRNTSSEGETGPYLQYAHCRLMSIKKKNSDLVPEMDESLLEQEPLNLMFFLSKFSTAIQDSYTTSEPCKIVRFLMDLSKQVNSLFSTLRVYGEEKKVAQTRLAVFEAARMVLCNGMKILGLKPLERM